ncbi:hypothetical protein IW492_08920 [Enterococcus sp. BWB1-3]|uniref:C47 family peptidase n=1 Tax=Enterococcus sp. BWB1-3 TaxID=2787713 RepID=UPI0019242D79|nr:C47 family peptidase [Enterococcus sp. BWB1-3]MBL1229350.1 hypothetical protein [Enterococcus sp. BWB1-3]
MKKKFWVIYLLVLFGSLWVNVDKVNAETQVAGEGLKVETTVVSNDIEEFAKKDFSLSLSSILILEENTKSINDFVLGSSFSMFDGEDAEKSTIYYPVFFNDKVEYLYLVRDNGEYGFTSSLTRFLVDEINSILSTNEGQIVSFFVSNNDIYFKVNDGLEKIYEAPKENQIPWVAQPDPAVNIAVPTEDVEVKDVSVETQVDVQSNSDPSKARSSLSVSPTHTMISFAINEIQTDLPWCAAYAVAGILSNKQDARPTRAIDILNYTFPSLTPAERQTKGVNQDQLVQYGRSRSTAPIRVGSVIYHDQILTDLRKGNAIYLGTQGYSGSTSINKSRHAFALFGWVDHGIGAHRVYYLWNPWWNYPMTVLGDTYPFVIPVPGGSYVWDSTIYNW